MVVRHAGVEHAVFRDLPAFLRAGDLLVLNETRVIAARLFGTRASGGKVELLLLHPSSGRYDAAQTRWQVLAKPARRLKIGDVIRFGDDGSARVCALREGGVREVCFTLKVPFESFLERQGRLALPPYIHNASQDAQRRYQTIFARVPGSVAAPTASLHFTKDVFEALDRRGVEMVKLVLDVGLGTFRPMTEERLERHVMHAETYDIPAQTAAAISQAQTQGRRVVAAGTTVVRALEGSAQQYGGVSAGSGETSLFIKPGFRFRVVDAMITNFHLPRSTLLVLVSAFAGRERIMNAYRVAVEEGYRFFSFGDAMLLERGDDA